MVKQNKAKVSKSKWVFLLNVIASGMGVDSYWSASSSAITAGMAIRQARWVLGKQAFSPLTACGLSGKRLEKNQSSPSCAADRTIDCFCTAKTQFEKHCDRCIPWSMDMLSTHLLRQIVAWNSWVGGKIVDCWFVIRLNQFIFSFLLIS